MFLYQCLLISTHLFILSFQTIYSDLFAKEIAWTIVDNESQETVDRRPFGYYSHENEVREEVFLRPGQIYTFAILDVYGDGIVNNGYYQIFAADGERETPIVEATKFSGREQQRTFRVPIPFFDEPSMQPSSAPSPQPSSIDFEADESNDMACISDGNFCNSDHDCCNSKCKGGLCLVSSSSSSRLDQRIHSDTAEGSEGSERVPGTKHGRSWQP